MINVSDKVIFIGHGYRRAIAYRYSEMFGEREWEVIEVRESCCNRFLMLKGIDGIYSEKFFRKSAPTPLIPVT